MHLYVISIYELNDLNTPKKINSYFYAFAESNTSSFFDFSISFF